MLIPLDTSGGRSGFPAMTALLVAVNLAIFLTASPVTVESWSFDLSLSRHFPTATWLTYAFLHGDWWHLLGNMWMLFVFGWAVESRWGAGQFLIVYLLCAAGAAVTQAALMPEPGLMIGASGAVSGILGALTVLDHRQRVLSLLFLGLFGVLLEVRVLIYLGLWIALHMDAVQSLYSSEGVAENVAWFAHLGGCAVGMIVALAVRVVQRRRRFSLTWPGEQSR